MYWICLVGWCNLNLETQLLFHTWKHPCGNNHWMHVSLDGIPCFKNNTLYIYMTCLKIFIFLRYCALWLGVCCPTFSLRWCSSLSLNFGYLLKNWTPCPWRWGHHTVSEHWATNIKWQSTRFQKHWRFLLHQFESLKTDIF